MTLRTRVDRGAIPPAALGLCTQIAQRGHGVWVVGGCVRDHLLGRDVADWDLCTTARPDELLKIFPRAIPTGIEHGTITVMVDKVGFEITTLRGETTYTDGRRPDRVFYVDDIAADLARRDLTVNAIAYDVQNDRLIDPYGGMADLERRLLRAVGNPIERFSEDGLRVLRAARFVATLEFDLDPGTRLAIPQTLDTFRKVSAERVREEWVKTMAAREPSRAFDVMQTTGILGAIDPSFDAMVGCKQNHYHQFDVWTHTLQTVDRVPLGDPTLRLAALLHDIGKPTTREERDNGEATFLGHERVGAEMADDFLKRYRFSTDERQHVTHWIRHHLVAYEDSWSDAAVRRFVQRVGMGAIDTLLTLCRADSMAKGDRMGDDLARLAKLRARIDGVIAAGSAFTTRDLAVNGNDLQRELGIPPSKRLGEILGVLLERVLDDPSRNERGQLLELARQEWQPRS